MCITECKTPFGSRSVFNFTLFLSCPWKCCLLTESTHAEKSHKHDAPSWFGHLYLWLLFTLCCLLSQLGPNWLNASISTKIFFWKIFCSICKMEIVPRDDTWTNVRWEHPHTGSIPLVIGWHKADLKTRWGQDLCGDAQQVGNWDISHRSHFLLTIMISHLLHTTPGEPRGQSWWTPNEKWVSSVKIEQ